MTERSPPLIVFIYNWVDWWLSTELGSANSWKLNPRITSPQLLCTGESRVEAALRVLSAPQRRHTANQGEMQWEIGDFGCLSTWEFFLLLVVPPGGQHGATGMGQC